MANDTIKISQLNELEVSNNEDFLPIVDSTEVETKKITKQNLLTDIDAEEVQIGQLTEATQINDEDYLIITQNGTNKKISKANAKFASGDEVYVGDTEPTGEDDDSVKFWIEPSEDSVDAEGTYISNEYGIAQDKGYSQEYLNGTILYENATGTNGNITLNDDVSNYRYLEIFGYETIFNSSIYTKYDLSTGKKINLSNISTQGEQNRLQSATYSINGTTLTFESAYMNVVFGTTINSQTNNNEFNITKIIGYK